MTSSIGGEAIIRPSPYQQAIMGAYGKRNIIVQAVAGSGKSKTLEMIIRECIPKTARVSLLAFNKPIATELKSRGLPASTFNGLGFGVTSYSFKNPIVEGDKIAIKAKGIMTQGDFKNFGSSVINLVAKAYTIGLVPDDRIMRSKGLRAVTQDHFGVWLDLIDTYEIEVMNGEEDQSETIIDISRRVMVECLSDTKMISFDDQISFPVLYDLPMKPYDHLLVDEAQDTNPIQVAFLKKALRRGGVFTAVGDRFQSLYKFRGASSDAMDQIKTQFNCVEYPLSICYRCPPNVVALAKELVPQIEAVPGRADGVVKTLTKHSAETYKAGDFIISRKNADLVSMAYKLMAVRIPCVIMGRDMASGLITLMKKVQDNYRAQKRTENEVQFLLDSLDSWRQREVKKAEDRDNEKKIQEINDRFATLGVIVESSEADTIQDVINECNSLFGSDKEASRLKETKVMLMSIHKSKGDEAERVFWLERSNCPSQYTRTADQEHTELCIQYVALTRAKSEMYFIELAGWQS